MLMAVSTSLLAVGSGMRVISSDWAQDVRGRAEVANSSLKGYEEFTLCARVLTHQFRTVDQRAAFISLVDSPLLAYSVGLPQYRESSLFLSLKMGDAWRYKRVFAWYQHDFRGFDFFPVWQPGHWNSVCISVSKKRTSITFNVNGKKVGGTNRLDHRDLIDRHPGNVFLMNSKNMNTPSDGAISDVNIWGRVLSEQEMKDWEHCRDDPGGAVISWQTAEINTENLLVSHLDREEMCLKNRTGKTYSRFNKKRNFHQTEKFCANVGGRQFTVHQQSYREISSVNDKEMFKDCAPFFFTGFQMKDNTWIDVNNGESLTWGNWIDGDPQDNKRFDCILQLFDTGKIFNSFCADSSVCPICQMEEGRENFILRGVCVESAVDAMFVMLNSDQFLGYTNSMMRYSVERSRWEIVSTINTTNVLAFMRTQSDFPLGLNDWYFLDSNCSDPGQEFRALHFHLDVKQPGHFCCDDGTCLDSQLVCDDFSDCDDGSDENNCTFINFNLHSPKHNTETPPTEIKNGKKKPIVLNATFNVLDIFGIDEVDSTFDLHFILEIQWSHHFISFEFLKSNDYHNFLLKTLKENMWIPKVEFSEIAEVIQSSRNDNDNVIVLRRGKPRLDTHLDSVRSSEVYTGQENPMKILIERRIKFSCSFDSIKNFPFGRQKCSLKFQLVEASNHIKTIVKGNHQSKKVLDNSHNYEAIL